MKFNDLEYTRESLAKELYLIEKHSKDGSAVDAACACIHEKHLFGIEGLAEEGITIAKNDREKKFYRELADFTRKLRKTILTENFVMPGNSGHGHKLTACEKKLSKCLTVNPAAECRERFKCS